METQCRLQKAAVYYDGKCYLIICEAPMYNFASAQVNCAYGGRGTQFGEGIPAVIHSDQLRVLLRVSLHICQTLAV